jgi:hypothetical protein
MRLRRASSRRPGGVEQPHAAGPLDPHVPGQDREERPGARVEVGGQGHGRAQVAGLGDPEHQRGAAAAEALHVEHPQPPPGRRGRRPVEVLVEVVALFEVLEPVVLPVLAQAAPVRILGLVAEAVPVDVRLDDRVVEQLDAGPPRPFRTVRTAGGRTGWPSGRWRILTPRSTSPVRKIKPTESPGSTAR